MADTTYEAAVKETFETKPLRTVLMIDDEFPTFADLARGGEGKHFNQKERALALYEGFRLRQMICDVENHVDGVHTERFRKSDLIILDYNLGPSDPDNEKSIGILRRLASSKHFTTIVVYTANPDQDEVWLEILASLSGGWMDLPGNLAGDAQIHWERLFDEDKLPTATLKAVMEFAARRELRDLSGNTRKAAQDELVALGVPPSACGEIISAMIHRELARRAGKYAGEPRSPAVGGYANGNRWIQSRNSFIAILEKEDLTDDATDPAGIMACLGKALLSWRPNLFQILISEIQNILELEALATEDVHLREPATQTALWYYLLEILGPLDLSTSPDVKAPLMAVIDKIVDGIRRRLSSDSELIQLASDALLGELKDAGWTAATWPKRGESGMLVAATNLARTAGLTTGHDVLFRLNSFFSTERFRRAHITTGTIFRHPGSDTYWVTASPACDLVARQPSEQQVWTHAIHPLTAVVAIRLSPDDNINGALTIAARGRHIFLETTDGPKVFRLVNDVSQPIYEFIFAENEGRVREEDGKTIFTATRLIVKDDGSDRTWITDTFEVIDQLRGLNATQVLQLAGQHLSRIGLDFVDMPKK